MRHRYLICKKEKASGYPEAFWRHSWLEVNTENKFHRARIGG